MALAELRKMLDEKKISAVELTQYYIERIKKYDNKLNSYITVCEEFALIEAEESQKVINSGRSKALTGIPVTLKDNICTKGIRTTCASRMLENFVPGYDAKVTEKLKDQHFIMLGKTNMDEFAMGSDSQTSFFKGVKNPYNISYVPGGSSGGAAAAVSADLCAAAIASDTGGSIRQPAAFCGVTGLKPTYGRVSRRGLIAFAPSLDQIGVIAKSAKDTGYVLNVLAGKDTEDMTSCDDKNSDFISKCGKISSLKIGLPKELFTDIVTNEVKQAVFEAVEFYRSIGCEIIECSLPSLEYAVMAYYIISSSEAASNLERFDGVKYGYTSQNGSTYEEIVCNSRREGFGDEVKRRILLGNYALSSGCYDEYYRKAMEIRKQMRSEYDAVFEKCDVILSPTAPTASYKIGLPEYNPVKRYSSDICTVAANIVGLPEISTTCGYDNNGMPIGMSITGRAYDEETIIAAADMFESVFNRQEAVL